MRVTSVKVAGLVVLLLVRPATGDEDRTAARRSGNEVAAPRSDHPEIWRVANRCAVNAVYLMARLQGKDVDYRAIDSAAAVTEKGTSLADVRRLATKVGMNVRIVKATPAMLSGIQLPIIAHLEEESGTTGHYVVVTAIRPDGVEVIETTAAILQFMPSPKFRKIWTGYLVINDNMSSFYGTTSKAILLAGAVTVAASILLQLIRRRGAATATRLPGGSTTVAGAALMLLAAVVGTRSVRAADQAAADPSTLGRIKAGIESQWGRVHSLSVNYTYSEKPLVDMRLVKKYLGKKILNSRDTTYAFKGRKRYSKQEFLVTNMKDLAPDTEPDYSVIPDGLQIKKKLDARKASGKPYPQDGKSFVIPPGAVSAFNEVELRRAEPSINGWKDSFASTLAILPPSDVKNEAAAFPQEYLANLVRTLPDAIHTENSRKAERLPDAFELGVFVVRPEREEVDGASCIVVGQPGVETFWLDPELNYSVRRYERLDRESKLLKERRDNHRFEEIAPGVWLPKLCSRDICAPPQAPPDFRGKPLLRHEYLVKSIAVNDVPDSLFELKAPAGWNVADATRTSRTRSDGLEKYINYRMPADERQLDDVARQSLELHRQSIGEGRWRQRGKVLLIGANLVLLIGFVIYIVYREQRKRQASKPSP